MKLTMLGTGNAGVTECYNTCFAIENEGEYLLVDGGGGNILLRQLRKAGIRWQDIRSVFVTHRHTDHLMGIFWLMRMINNSRDGELAGKTISFYGHDEAISLIRNTTMGLFPREDGLHPAIRLNVLEDGQEFQAIGHTFRAFDIQSTKAKQFGFTMHYGEGKTLTCCGDESYRECERTYVEGHSYIFGGSLVKASGYINGHLTLFVAFPFCGCSPMPHQSRYPTSSVPINHQLYFAGVTSLMYKVVPSDHRIFPRYLMYIFYLINPPRCPHLSRKGLTLFMYS